MAGLEALDGLHIPKQAIFVHVLSEEKEITRGIDVLYNCQILWRFFFEIRNHSREKWVPAFGVGDIVAVVEAESTPQQPKIILGKILRMEGNTREVLLAHLEPAYTEVGQETFRFVVGSSWKESYE